MVINSYHHGLSWTDSQMDGLFENLNGKDFEVYVEYLDAKRFQKKEYFNHTIHSIINKYQGSIKVDAIVVTDDYALKYAVKSIKEYPFFSQRPIVFSGINFYHDSIKQQYPNITGVVESYDLISTVDAAVKIQNGVENIVIINDLTVTGYQNRHQINLLINHFNDKLSFSVYNDYSFEDIALVLSNLNYPEDAVVLLSMNRDSTEKYFEFEEASSFVSQHSNVPVYGVWDFYLNNGSIGGMITCGCEQGKSAADLVKKIVLENIPVKEIPVIKESPNKYIFDYVYLEKFNIDVSQLPVNSTVLNQPDPFLIRNKNLIRNFIFFIIFQSLVIIILTFVNRIFRKRSKKLYENNRGLVKKVFDNSTLLKNIKEGLDQNSLASKKHSLTIDSSLDLFKKVFEKSLTGYIVFNRKLEILKINDTALDILGYNRDEYVLFKKINFFLDNIQEVVFLDGISEKDCEINNLKGKKLFCRVYFSSVVSGDDILRLAVIKNITDEKLNITRLESNNTQLESRYDTVIKELNETNRRLIFEINERIVRQKELFNTKERLKKIVDTIDSLIVVVNSNFLVTAHNLKAQKASVCDIENLINTNKDFEECFKYYGAKNRYITQVINENNALHINSHNCKVNDKSIFVDLSFFPMPSYSGYLSEVLVKIDDVTDKINLQKMIFHSEKMMSVGSLAAGMAHEINNPLGGILQGTQNIERRLLPGFEKNIEVAQKYNTDLESLQGYLEERKIFYFLKGIKESGQKAAEIIKSLLKFSLSTGDDKQLININNLCAHTVELAYNDYELKKKYSVRNIDFIQDYQDNPKDVYCSSSEIELVLLGLIKNGVYAIRKREINQESTKSSYIKIKTQYSQSYAYIFIEDNGCGVDENITNRIFEPFFTTNQTGQGSGLGLSVAYSVITHNHKGSIELEKSHEGTTLFKISLPL